MIADVWQYAYRNRTGINIDIPIVSCMENICQSLNIPNFCLKNKKKALTDRVYYGRISLPLTKGLFFVAFWKSPGAVGKWLCAVCRGRYNDACTAHIIIPKWETVGRFPTSKNRRCLIYESQNHIGMQ